MPTTLVTCDPRAIDWVLRSRFDNYVKGSVFRAKQRQLLGDGIFNVDGDAWRKQRKAAAHLFTVRGFRDHMLGVFDARLEGLCSKIDASLRDSSGPLELDMAAAMFDYTLSSFLEIGFGSRSGSADDARAFGAAFDEAQAIAGRRALLPPAILWVVEAVTGRRRRMKECVAIVDGYAGRLIAERRATRLTAADQGDRQDDVDQRVDDRDLLDRFMDIGALTGDAYTDRELRDIVVNFVIAGRDTTAQALSWTLYEIARRPTVAATIRAEMAAHHSHLATPPPSTHGDDDRGEEDRAEHFAALSHRLVYTRAVLLESLRLHPPVPLEVKQAVNDDVLPDGTRVHAGDRIVWPLWAMARLEGVWGSDAGEFCPERWIRDGKCIAPSPSVWPVFNAGPRACLGQQMAMLEAVACITTLLGRYDMELVDPNGVQYRIALTLPMERGLRMRVTSRPTKM
ncbi:cytochrome P450 [Blastocladiella britannica]|nr:cytochrome P450 [Blastocladiella britannica]